MEKRQWKEIRKFEEILFEEYHGIAKSDHSTFNTQKSKFKMMKWKRIIDIAVKVVVAAVTAFVTAVSTTSCMGHGPIAL